MAVASVFAQILDYANRANPYPLFAELRRTPVARQEDGSYVVSTYREIAALLHDPRISSDLRKRNPIPATAAQPSDAAAHVGTGGAAAGPPAPQPELPPEFLVLDPPEHDRVRRLAMRQFGPPHAPRRVDGLRDEMAQSVKWLIDRVRDQRQIDITESIAYPFPVAVICQLLVSPTQTSPTSTRWPSG